jgi:uncharacterized glyoxalase superfamily protein PhnB
MNELEAKLSSGNYDILFTDAVLAADAQNREGIAVITESKVKDEIEKAIKAHRG